MAGYGDLLDANGIKGFLEFFVDANLAQETANGDRPTPICIWGTHGLGKTQIVRAIANDRKWPLAYCAPAQFEEMGDLHGLPIKIIPEDGSPGYTSYLPPQWVPQDEGPGILLFDDINRADDRILRGLMQLLQNFEMFSWRLPRKWQIVLTANPEDGNYSVTPMDDAMLTRMIHVTMKFDAKIWAAWAMRSGVHPVGIDFVLTYPEIVDGARTTPRSLVQVFSKLPQEISEIRRDIARVATITRGGLDEATVASFIAYVNDEMQFMVSPLEILEADDFTDVGKRVLAAYKGGARTVRVDRVSTICTRLLLTLSSAEYERPTPRNKENLVQFLALPEIPADLRFSVHKDIVAMGGDRAKLVEDQRLAKLVLKAM
jgi:hypothetical protein